MGAAPPSPFRLAGPGLGIARVARKRLSSGAERRQLQCYLEPARVVKQKLGIDRLPDHIAAFGEYMVDMAEKHLEPHHVAKAYLITNASIQRDSIFGRTVKERWPGAPFADSEKVRPEDAMAAALSSTPEGQRYIAEAAEGRFDRDSAKTIVRWMSAWGLKNNLLRQFKAAPDLAVAAPEVERVLRLGSRREWLQFIVANARGINYAKAGFLGSILGRGDLATVDAREMAVWAPTMARDKDAKASVTPEFVEVVNQRLRALDIEMPEKLRPFYEHLAHHAIWDAAGGQVVLHQQIQDCMRGGGGT